MTSEQFTTWLEGYLTGLESSLPDLSPPQKAQLNPPLQTIKSKLKEVHCLSIYPPSPGTWVSTNTGIPSKELIKG